jgi:hypothetical protein
MGAPARRVGGSSSLEVTEPGLNFRVMRSRFLLAAAFALLALAACRGSTPPQEVETRTAYRTDFTPEEFGVGRAHTRSDSCNRDIDRLLEEIRACYNASPGDKCTVLQRANSDKIGHIKLARRCRR